MKRTSRGFGIYTKFNDTRGAEVRVQASSEAGVRRCWIFVKGGTTLGAKQRELAEACAAVKWQMPGSEIISDSTSAHLTPSQARRVAKALLRFAGGAR